MIKEEVMELIDNVLDDLLDQHCPEKEYPENWNWRGLKVRASQTTVHRRIAL